MNPLKEMIAGAVDRLGDELERLSHSIHDHPELGYQEVKAAAWLTEFLDAQGFKVERGVAGVETAFRATLETGEGPTIAILCEYDALPGIGHACGHNAIATAGVGAGAGLAAVRDRLPAGRVLVIGTPAEEGGGGKVRLIKGGVFTRVDAAMMVHGWDRWVPHMDLLGIVRVGLEFTGKAAHASADPWEGVNALDAAVQTYTNVAMLRQQVRPDARIHGIITHGGAAPEIKDRLGSSDVGNVSHVIPAIQPLMKIAPDGTPIHSRAFAAAARSPLAREGTLTASKAMAMTTLDLLADASLVRKAQAEFKAST